MFARSQQTMKSTKDFRQGRCQSIHILNGVKRAGAGTHRPSHRERTQGAMNIRGAVKSRSHRNVERLVENASQFRRRQRFGAETQRTHSPRSVAPAVHGDAVDFLQAATEALDQLVLTRVDLFHALRLDVTNACRQPRYSENIGCAAFEQVREFARLRLTGGVAASAALT